ncbi:MAG TPA: SCP2 sterol-binding domain-containing protein [Acidimicrobiales bacterium]
MVEAFLSDAWFDELNVRLDASELVTLPEGASACDVAFDLTDVPTTFTPALTLSITSSRAHVTPGHGAHADVTLQLSYDDAAALVTGRLDSTAALRDGRVKVRGDVNVLIPLASWLQAVFV